MRVTPKHMPCTATQLTEGNLVALAQRYRRELYVTDSTTSVKWDADTILSVGDCIVTNTMGRVVDVCDNLELLQNYTIEETE